MQYAFSGMSISVYIMDYISDPNGCWTEDNETGRVTLIQRASQPLGGLLTRRQHLDTTQGHRYELWQAIDLAPSRVWASKSYELFPGQRAVVTMFVDTEINTIYVMVPSIVGSTVKISAGSHSELIDECRSRMCACVGDWRTFAPSHVRQLFEAMNATSSIKLQDIATIALASFATDHPNAEEVVMESEYDQSGS
jgi:hypothetical protein